MKIFNPFKKIKDLEEKVKFLETLLIGEFALCDKEVEETISQYIQRVFNENLQSTIDYALWQKLNEFDRNEVDYINILDRLTQLEQFRYTYTNKDVQEQA